jgi:hypothetical protein
MSGTCFLGQRKVKFLLNATVTKFVSAVFTYTKMSDQCVYSQYIYGMLTKFHHISVGKSQTFLSVRTPKFIQGKF